MSTPRRTLALFAGMLMAASPLARASDEQARVLFVCHSVSHIHPSVVPAELALRRLGERHGFELTCFRYTHDPEELATSDQRIYGRPTQAGQPYLPQYSAAFESVTGEPILPRHCGRLDAATLGRFQTVIFFTKDDPCGTPQERQALLDFVRSGHGFVGVHSATVTHYDWPEYGQMLGGYFDCILLLRPDVPLVAEDCDHPATKALPQRFAIEHELYQFRQPYDRTKLEVLLRVDPDYVALLRESTPAQGEAQELNRLRPDGDLAVSWCRAEGRGRVFYTALGHPVEQWEDPRFLDHLRGGLQWAMSATQQAAPGN